MAGQSASAIEGDNVQGTWAIGSQVLLAFALALMGGAISISVEVSHERLCRLISLAAGTLLGVTLFSIVPESYSALPLWQLATVLPIMRKRIFLDKRRGNNSCFDQFSQA